MVNLHWILMILAFLLFVLAAAGVQSRINLSAAGLALLTLALMPWHPA